MTFSASKATRAVRASIESDTQHGAVVPPLHLSSNFAFAGLGEPRQYDYTRAGNPTRDALADALAELEGGAGAVVTSSGMAALTLLTQLLEPGDTIIAPHDCYGGTYRLFEQQSRKGLFKVKFVDQTNLDALRKALPDCDEADLYWSYHFLSGALTLTFAETGRIDNLSGGICNSKDVAAINERMHIFLAAGFKTLCDKS